MYNEHQSQKSYALIISFQIQRQNKLRLQKMLRLVSVGTCISSIEATAIGKAKLIQPRVTAFCIQQRKKLLFDEISFLNILHDPLTSTQSHNSKLHSHKTIRVESIEHT